MWNHFGRFCIFLIMNLHFSRAVSGEVTNTTSNGSSTHMSNVNESFTVDSVTSGLLKDNTVVRIVKIKNENGNDVVTLPYQTSLVRTFTVYLECVEGVEFNLEVLSQETEDVLEVDDTVDVNVSCRVNNTASDSARFQVFAANCTSNRRISLTEKVKVFFRTGRIGATALDFRITPSVCTKSLTQTSSLKVLVIRDLEDVDYAFYVTLYVLEILEMLTFGTQLDLSIVKQTLKHPIPPLIGFLSQYVGMPLISFALAKLVAQDSLTAIGIFVAGICPGGGTSNIYAYLLDGDLSLSITMTTISTFLSLGMIPLWLYTLGNEFLEPNSLAIPYSDIIVTLSIIFVPLSVGLLIRNKLPKLADLIEKIMPVVLTVLALILIVTGIISGWYLFRMFDWKIILLGCALGYIGFSLGLVVSFLCKQSWKNIKTIAVEIGMQNTGIAMILLLQSFGPPVGDIASVAPLSAEVMSPIPLFLASVVYLVWKTCCKKYKPVNCESESNSFDDEVDWKKSNQTKTCDIDIQMSNAKKTDDCGI